MRDFKNLYYSFFYRLNDVIPNLLASALASGAQACMFWILVLLEGCVLKNSGGALPFS